MFNVRLAGVWETAVHLAVAGGVFDGVFFVLSFFPQDVLDEIWDLIESVSEGFLIYSFRKKMNRFEAKKLGRIEKGERHSSPLSLFMDCYLSLNTADLPSRTLFLRTVLCECFWWPTY